MSPATKKQAELSGAKLDKVAFAVFQCEAPSPDVATWLQSLDDQPHNRLAERGLVSRRVKPSDPLEAVTFGAWVDGFVIRENRKAGTSQQPEIAGDNLKQFFGAERPLASITAGDAQDYRVWLQTGARKFGKRKAAQGLAHNTARRRMGRAKEVFADAVRRKVIAESPFAGEVAAVGASQGDGTRGGGVRPKPLHARGQHRHTFEKIVTRAGMTVWPKLLQNLRATRETELLALNPIKDVASWLGNSAPVAMKHYAMSMESSFEKAIQNGARGVVKKVPQNPPHQPALDSENEQQPEMPENEKSPQNTGFCGLASSGFSAANYPART